MFYALNGASAVLRPHSTVAKRSPGPASPLQNLHVPFLRRYFSISDSSVSPNKIASSLYGYLFLNINYLAPSDLNSIILSQFLTTFQKN